MQLRRGTEVRVSVLGGVGCGRVVRPGGTAMSKDGTGKMYCLAGIGWRVDAIMANTRGAARVLAVHGCAQECARRTLELAGFSGFEHLKLWEMGFKKGETLLTPERIRVVADAGAGLLAG